MPELGQVHDYAVDPVFVGRMRIGYGIHALVFVALAAARPLRHADEETLIGCETIGRIQLLATRRISPRDIGQQGTAQVGHILAQRELRIDLDVVDHGVVRILIGNALRALLKLLGIVFGPPVLQVSLGVELAALVIEAMRELVA